MKIQRSPLDRLTKPITDMDMALNVIRSASELWFFFGVLYFFVFLITFSLNDLEFNKINGSIIGVSSLFIVASYGLQYLKSRFLAIIMVIIATILFGATGAIIINGNLIALISIIFNYWLFAIAYRAVLASFSFHKLNRKNINY